MDENFNNQQPQQPQPQPYNQPQQQQQPYNQPQPQQQPYNQQQPQQNYYDQPPQPQNKNSKSTAAFALGIVSLASSILCCGGIIPIATGIIGLILGLQQKKLDANDSKANMGFIFSIIGLGLGVVLGIISLVLVMSGALNNM